MKQKKEFKYRLKNDVRQDLLILHNRIEFLLDGDLAGFTFIPPRSILPALFRAFSHLIWCAKFESWFKKVYE